VQRERASKSYRVLPYYLSRFICDIPLRVGQGLLFGGWCQGLRRSSGVLECCPWCCVQAMGT
jgi:hypothetical protein